jgi:hypothetical protein
MKKIYVSLSVAILASSMASAQHSPVKRDFNAFSPFSTSGINENARPGSVNELKSGITIWSNNFSTPSDWVINNSGQTGNAFGWRIGSGTNNSWAFNTNINSTSGGNYAECNNGNPSANPGTQALNVVYTMTTATSIDIPNLSANIDGTDQVSLEFLQYGARFNDAQEVYISTNSTNGIDGSWIMIGDNSNFEPLVQGGGSAYPNPSAKKINLAPYISGNAGTVWIRFSWTTAIPSLSTNPNVWVTYGWFIDDVKITTNPINDVSVTSTTWGTEGLFYYQIPTTQVAPIEFSASVFNEGTVAQSNVQLNVDINSGAFTTSSPATAIPSLGTASLSGTEAYTPAAMVGNHILARSISLGNLPNGQVLTGALVGAGAGYTTQTDVAVTGGDGTGLTLDIIAEEIGVGTSGTLSAAGTGYVDATDVATSTTGSGMGLTLDITAEEIGEGTSGTLSAMGSGYMDASSVATTTTGAGVGLTLDITAEEIGMAENTTIHAAGDGYVDATNVNVTGGAGTGATFDITADPIGGATSLSIGAPGSLYVDGIASTIAMVGVGSGLTLNIITDLFTGEILSATIVDGGSDYLPLDYVYVDGGDFGAIIDIMSVTNGEVTGVAINQSGNGYVAGDLVTLDGGNSNAIVEITAVSAGEVLSATIIDGGMDYSVGDVVTISGGNADATFTVDAVTEGMITSVSINSGGTDYTVGDVLTIVGGNDDATFTVDAVTEGEIIAVSINSVGTGYATGDVVTIDGGTATYEVTDVTNDVAITDAIPSNNAIPNLTFQVTNHLYARDNNVPSGQTTNGTNGYETGNLFDIWQNATVYAINTRLVGGAQGTTVGSEVYAQLYVIEEDGSFGFVGTSQPKTITSAMLNNSNLSFAMLTPAAVTAGRTYLAVVGCVTEGLRVATAGTSDPQTTFLLDQADGVWYFSLNTPMVRLNFDQVAGVENTTKEVAFAVYPNPVSNEANISFELLNSTTVHFEITDIYGKIVSVMNMGNHSAGSYVRTIDTDILAAGVYFLTIKTDGSATTQKFIKK